MYYDSRTITLSYNSYDYYLVLYNNNTNQCTSIFSASISLSSLSSGVYLSIPYGVTEAFKSDPSSSGYDTLVVSPGLYSPISISYYVQAQNTDPSSIPNGMNYESLTMYGGVSERIFLPYSISSSQKYYVYVRCNSNNCPLSLRLASSSYDSDSVSALIGFIVGPILCVLCCVCLPVCLLATCLARRRKRLDLAASRATIATITTTHTTSQPMLIPTSTIITTDSFLHLDEQPPIVHNTNDQTYGNQAFYSQPNQHYDNSGVGVSIPLTNQEPFNPNFDRV